MSTAAEIIGVWKTAIKENLPEGYELESEITTGTTECLGGREIGVTNYKIRVIPQDGRSDRFMRLHKKFPETVIEVNDGRLGQFALGFVRNGGANDGHLVVDQACDKAGCKGGENCKLIHSTV